MHYKVNAYNSRSVITLGAATLLALGQKVNAYQLGTDRPVTLAGFFRVEDNGIQIPLSDVERDEALDLSFGPA